MSILHLEGAYENELAATGEFNPQAPKTALMLPSGKRIVLATEVLLQAMDAGPLPGAEPPREPVDTGRQEANAPANEGADALIPLVAEQILVQKTEVETARVRLRRETQERTETVSVPLTDVRWEVEHVPVERVVDAAPEIRQVDETTIFPLVEERLMVRRELWLREEVHVRKVKTVVEKSADFAVKRDVLIEERTETQPPNPGA